MKKRTDIFDLIKEKLNDPAPLDELDWKIIQKKTKQKWFLKLALNQFNIYYLAFLLTGSAVVWAYFASDTKSLATIKEKQLFADTIYAESSENTAVQNLNTPCPIQDLDTVSFSIRNPDPKQLKIQKSSVIDFKPTLSAALSVFIPAVTEDKKDTFEQKLPKEIIKKEPIIITLQDTIYDLDSNKVSRRKMKKMQ